MAVGVGQLRIVVAQLAARIACARGDTRRVMTGHSAVLWFATLCSSHCCAHPAGTTVTGSLEQQLI